MGNHPAQQNILKMISSFEVIKKYSRYSILKSHDGIEYVKFLYTPISSDNQSYQSVKYRSSFIFNTKYLQYRFQSQQNNLQLKGLPKIFAFGSDPETQNIITCTGNQFNFVIFQHPTKTFKLEIQNRISLQSLFKQSELLSLIKCTAESLFQYYDHIKNWNKDLLQKRPFVLTLENIFINSKQEFIVSDILSNFLEIQDSSKHETTIKKSSRANSMTNLHAKISEKKLRQKYLQTNFNSLVCIIQKIVQSFESFNGIAKNSNRYNKSQSTALQPYREQTRFTSLYSSSFNQLLKSLRQNYFNEKQILQQIDLIINMIHLPTPIEKSEKTLKNSEHKNSFERIFQRIDDTQQIKISSFDSYALLNQFNKRQTQNDQQEYENQFIKNQRFIKPLENVITKNHLASINLSKQKKPRQRSIKIRLSLKKQSSNQQRPENIIAQNQGIKIKNSYPQFICAKKYQSVQSLTKKSIIGLQINFQSKRKRSQTLKIQPQTDLKLKICNNFHEEKLLNLANKKIILRKKKNHNKQNIIMADPKAGGRLQPEKSIHLNPMTRKKALGFNKFLTCKQSQQSHHMLKAIENKTNQMDLSVIQNLSSITSNQNNTLSSYGILLTDEFKTDHSIIQDQGFIGFQQNQKGQSNKLSYHDILNNQSSKFNKKVINTFSPPSIKRPTFSSFQFVQSIIQKPRSKIPQFLKQFKLPEKHLLALNDIVLKQKDRIIEESFEQSQFNSIRQSVPNIEQNFSELNKKKNLKIDLSLKQTIILKDEQDRHKKTQKAQWKESIFYPKEADSIQRELNLIELSLIENR